MCEILCDNQLSLSQFAKPEIYLLLQQCFLSPGFHFEWGEDVAHTT